MKICRSLVSGALLLAAVSSVSAQAATRIVTFNFSGSNPTTVASGSFSYDDAKDGVIGYSDLLSFVITFPEHSYDLAFVNSGSFQSYRYFGYNEATNAFVAKDAQGYELLSAIKTSGTSGFFLGCSNTGCANDYADNVGDYRYSAVTLSASVVNGVPEPATWAMMIGGFGLVGGAMRRRSTKISYATA